MSLQLTTYSLLDVVGSFFHPLLGQEFVFNGNVGVGEISISMETDRTDVSVAGDGAVMMSYRPGDNGVITIQMQQTSDLHHTLLSWFNLVKTAADNHDVSNWANATFTLRSVTDSAVHYAIGVAPMKVPDKVYAPQGQMVSWQLKAASITNE